MRSQNGRPDNSLLYFQRLPHPQNKSYSNYRCHFYLLKNLNQLLVYKRYPQIRQHIRQNHLQPIAKAPFYCCRQNVGAYGSLGGVKINHRTQAMTQEAKVIPGLYCVGTDACNIFGDSYPFILSGNTMGFCLNSGRIAGENAAAELEEFEY